MLNNYLLLKLPLVNKNYFTFKEGEKGTYKYKGTAYILIDKRDNNIAFNTLLLDEDQTIWGADDGKYGNDYGIKKRPELFEYRKSSFNYSIPKGRSKNVSKFKNDISEFNELILKNKLTIKDVDGFISGSNSSGGLKKPEADPVRIFYGENDPLVKRYKGNLINEKNITWKFFSLISNIKGKFRNADFPIDITQDKLNSIEEIDINYLFDKLDWMFIPYKEKDYEDLHVPFKEAFASQNSEQFIDKLLENVTVSVQSDNNWRKQDHIQYVMEILERENMRALAKEVRAIWRRIVDEDIDRNKYKTDFVKNLPIYQRAHIMENHFATKILQSDDFSRYEKEEYLRDLFNCNNYLLLTPEIHSCWDNGQIYIDYNGDIVNKELTVDQFKVLTKDHKNIYSIYTNVLNKDREDLLNKRANLHI